MVLITLGKKDKKNDQMQENFIQNILLQNHKRPTAMSKPVELPFVTFHCSTQATGRMFYSHTAFSQKKIIISCHQRGCLVLVQLRAQWLDQSPGPQIYLSGGFNLFILYTVLSVTTVLGSKCFV